MNTKNVGLLLLLAVSQSAQAANETVCSVGGRVLKANNQDEGIDHVEITLYRDSTQVNQGHSKEDGSYSISCGPGSTITIVRYDHDDWVVSKIENISGKNSHTIYKTLVAKSKSFTASEMQEIVATLERMYELDEANNTVVNHSSSYLRLLQSIDEKAPPELKARIRVLRERYSTTVPRGPSPK